MATTSIWKVTQRIDKVVNYATDEEKTGVWQFWNKKIFESIANAYFFLSNFSIFIDVLLGIVI